MLEPKRQKKWIRYSGTKGFLYGAISLYLTKVSPFDNLYNMNWDTKTSEELFRAVLSLESLGEAKKFFRDLLTEEEILEFAKRWQVAKMLYNDIPYTAIQKETSLSTTTIARISKWLKSGMGGYRLVLRRLCHGHHMDPSRLKG